jgi:hypothetical protein
MNITTTVITQLSDQLVALSTRLQELEETTSSRIEASFLSESFSIKI